MSRDYVVRRNVWGRSPSPPAKRETKIPLKTSLSRSKSESGVKESSKSLKSSSKRERKSSSKHSKSRRYRSESPSSSDSSDWSSSESEERKRHRRKKSSKSSSAKKTRRDDHHELADTSASSSSLAGPLMPPPPAAVDEQLRVNDLEEAREFRREVQGEASRGAEGSDSEDDMGPQPMPVPVEYSEKGSVDYGKALRPGEGDAIAQFVQQNLRIPRRGEIGWTGDEIDRLENEGFVMSGSRHKRMNAVRLRKENQVYSAEEKRALAMITFEEKQQKENKVIGEFRDMLRAQLEKTGSGGTS